MVTFTDGQSVEVEGTGSGFLNSWWPAKILSQKGSAKIQVQYTTLYTDTSGDKKLVEEVPSRLVRPKLPSDKGKPLSSRCVGDAVDCWWEGGWWTGYVHVTEDTRLSVFFLGFQEDPVWVEDKPSRGYGPGDARVRTAKFFDRDSEDWIKIDPLPCAGCADKRTYGATRANGPRSPSKQKEQKDNVRGSRVTKPATKERKAAKKLASPRGQTLSSPRRKR